MGLKLVKEAPEQRAALESVSSGDGGHFDFNGKRIIQHDAGQLPRILDEIGAALSEFCAGGGNLFRWGAGLSRVYVLAEDEASGRDGRTQLMRWAGSVTLHPVDVAHLRELVGRAAAHEKYDGRAEKYKPCDCPEPAAKAYMARGSWPEIPPLSGFVECPTMTLDGRVLDAPGYDAETGLFAAWSSIPGYVSPPRTPSRRDAADAAETLAKTVATFPFVSPADQSAALAGMILAVCRRSLPSAPMLCVTAPTPGTGKTLLTDTISILATGRRASVMAMGHDEAEADKRLAGVLMAGDAMVNIDNVERPLGGDLLCQVLSQPVLKTRPLGASSMVDVPTHAIMAATGNNLSVQGDLKRRVTMIRMDAKLERPELRAFDGEPHLERVLRLRGHLIQAALTIPLAYLAAGAPDVGTTPLGGFEDWDRLVRRPLVWLGLSDPLDTNAQLRAEDPDLEATLALLTAWFDLFAGSAMTAADVIREGMASGEGFDTSAATNPELREALMLISNGRQPTARSLGNWLRARKDRVVAGKRFVVLPQDRNGVARWMVATGEAGISAEIPM